MSQKSSSGVAPQLINLTTRDAATMQQISTLLGIANTMLGVMGAMGGPTPEGITNDMKNTFGVAASSAEQTFDNVCKRLDKILAENDRWSDAFMRRVEQAMQDTHDANMAFAAAQKTAVERVHAPHFQYRPNVQRTRDGFWMAYLGDLSFPDGCIIGIGKTPQEAIDAFDGMFKGTLTPEMQKICAQRLYFLEHGINSEAPEEQQNEQPEEPNDSPS